MCTYMYIHAAYVCYLSTCIIVNGLNCISEPPSYIDGDGYLKYNSRGSLVVQWLRMYLMCRFQLNFHHRGTGLILGWGTKISHMSCSQNTENIKQKNYFNKFNTFKIVYLKKII